MQEVAIDPVIKKNASASFVAPDRPAATPRRAFFKQESGQRKGHG